MDRQHSALWDDDTREDPTTVDTRSRRHLLGTAAGGFALAAGGLLLPHWLGDEAEAAEHPVRRVQRRKEKKRERQRRRLEKRRNRRRRGTGNNQARAPRAGAAWVLSFYAYNDTPVTTPNGSEEIQYWYIDNDDDWKLHDATQVANGTSSGKLGPDSELAGLLIVNRGVFISAGRSVTPLDTRMMVSIEYGGKMTADGYEGGQFMLREKGLYQNEQVEVTGNGSHFTIQRLYDVFHNGGAFEKVFNVHFRPA